MREHEYSISSMIEISNKLNCIYKTTYGKININITTIILIIKNKINQINTPSNLDLMDLISAMTILLEELSDINYFAYIEIEKCLLILKNKQTYRCQSKSINYLYKNMRSCDAR